MPKLQPKVVSLRPDGARDNLVQSARHVFREQMAALESLEERVDHSFAEAIEMLSRTRAHVVVLGVGKSGLIGKKIAATLASTGTPAFFVNSAEAHHGDLGMVTGECTALLISHSGETEEVVGLLPRLRSLDIPLLALVGDMDSKLARGVDVALDVGVEREVCPNNLAPTTSTLTTLAMGDALAVALMQVRGFCAEDFAELHPGGSLGRRLLMRVSDAMRRNTLPVVSPEATVADAIIEMTDSRLGLVLVMNDGKLVGLVTDGDLRRAMRRFDNLLTVPIGEIMTTNPVTIEEDTLLVEARKRMKQLKLKALVVVSREGRPRGVVEIFDGK